MAIGVTSFISTTLARGTSFSPASDTTHCSALGLAIGRQTDHLARRVIAGKAKLSVNDQNHTRAVWFFDTLKRLQIEKLEAQVSVKDPSLGIRTQIDATGVDATGNLVIIELKTTQDSRRQHKERYYKRCRNCPTLANGLPNTEFWRHQLQCGFGMLCKNAHRGVVIVVCKDGALHYPVSSTAADRRMFDIPAAVARFAHPSANPASCHLLPWPLNADTSLKAAFAQRGYPTLESTDPIVFDGGDRGKAVAIIVNKTKNYTASKLARNHTAHLKTLAKSTKTKTKPFIVNLDRITGMWNLVSPRLRLK